MEHVNLAAEVESWIADDPDPQTAAELAFLLQAWRSGDEQARTELADRFSRPLEFGTAGLRGQMAGGPNRMNRAVVIRTAAGLGAFLHSSLTETTPPLVVIGYDARHRSQIFAQDSAAVLTAAGIQVRLLPRPLPTPVLAFAVRHLGADAGVMVTASHNPAQDNGYKVYLGGRVVTGDGEGVQIVPPFDSQIAAHIAQVQSAAAVPRADSGWTVLDDRIVDDYQQTAAALAPREQAGAGSLRIVLTAMHGVGAQVATQVLRNAGFTNLHLVAAQAEPDPDFPTVAFPNPEEPGALDLSFALAEEVGADLVLALDPDADRCAVAVLDPRSGQWRRLHGDETGALLGAMVAAEVSADPDDPNRPTLACSVVSSRLLGSIAAAAGLRFTTTLTGFKWISRTPGLVFGYEEALGYCVDPTHVRDKDGITAALRLAVLAAQLGSNGMTLSDRLDDLARRHGLHLSDQVSVRLADPEAISRLVEALRAAGPQELAGSPVVEVIDMAAGYNGFPAQNGMIFRTADRTQVVVRPSGTEPKIKCYLEVVEEMSPSASDAEVTTVREQARKHLDSLILQVQEFLHP